MWFIWATREKERECAQAEPCLGRAVSSEINSIFCPSATHGNCTKNNSNNDSSNGNSGGSGSYVAGRVLWLGVQPTASCCDCSCCPCCLCWFTYCPVPSRQVFLALLPSTVASPAVLTAYCIIPCVCLLDPTSPCWPVVAVAPPGHVLLLLQLPTKTSCCCCLSCELSSFLLQLFLLWSSCYFLLLRLPRPPPAASLLPSAYFLLPPS